MAGSGAGAGLTRRGLLTLLGLGAGGAAMYQAMAALGHAEASEFRGPPQLGAAPAGASVLVLGAGIAGMVAALELRNAGYRVQVLEYNAIAGGRCMTLRGGDVYTELGGEAQQVDFDPGLYFNPGPWRIPHHHHGILAYCKRLGVALENFVQLNYNALLHGREANGGKPRRFREVRADFHGHIAELLAKATQSGKLDQPLDAGDRERLLGALDWWGALDAEHRYSAGRNSSERRGFARDPGGGPGGAPKMSTPLDLRTLLGEGLWGMLPVPDLYEFQGTLLQPVGGMDGIARAFARELDGLIRLRARVVEIRQDAHGVVAHYEDLADGGARQSARADWCVCTLPLSVLAQLPINVDKPMSEAISALPYATTVKVGLQFKRRFWEEDEHIYGGVSYTDLPIGNIAYPSHGYHAPGKGVLLGGYLWGSDAYRMTSLPPAERVRLAVAQGSQLHPQYADEFDSGVAVAWHRVPGAMGCFAQWTDELRERHYAALTAFDGRIVLAGEHASYLPAWQEGAVTSALDAVTRLHERAVAAGAHA